MNWILRYIKSTIDVGLVFKKDITSKQECIRYANSDYVKNLDKCRSTMGFTFTLAQVLMSWRSTLHPTVTLSTTEVEYMAMIEAMNEAI